MFLLSLEDSEDKLVLLLEVDALDLAESLVVLESFEDDAA